MATFFPAYPASTLAQAEDLIIFTGNQLSDIVNGDSLSEVETVDGFIPTIRKTLVDNFGFKSPTDWSVGSNETVYNQLRKFTDGSWWWAPLATVSNPIAMTADPYVNTDWKVFSKEQLTVFENTKRLAAEAGYNLVGTFYFGCTVTTATDVVLNERDGKYYSWGGALPKVVAAGSSPVPESPTAWVDRTDGALRDELASETGAALVGASDGSTVAGRLLSLKRVSPVESRFAGGADPTGVADSTDALQACIDYCAPFVWQGSVAATKAAMGNVVAAMSGFGKFRITRPLKLNPFLVVAVDHSGSFYGANGGFQIIADFSDKDGFALDTAPYNASGQRVLGLKASAGDWDNSIYTGCIGWVLSGVSVIVANGRNLRGTLNRSMGIQSHVINCSLEGGNIGVQNSTCWGGSFKHNHVVARAICVYNSDDVTVDEQQANYLSVLGTKPVSGTEFTYPTWPDATLQGKTTPVYCEYAHPNFFHNILEGGKIAAMCTNSSNLNLLDNYCEGSGYEFIYAAHTVNLKIGLRVVMAANAGLIYSRASRITVDASSTSYLTVANLGDIDSFSSVRLLGSKTPLVYNLPWHPRVDYADIDANGVVDVYVSATGDDSNSGYSSTKPVLTLQEAFDRCKYGFANRINLSGAVGTKYNYTSGGNTTNKVITLDSVEINGGGSATLTIGASFDELHGIPMGIARVKFKDVKTVTIASIASNYKPLVPALGCVNIEIDGGTFSGGTLMGVKYWQVGFANLTVKNAKLACALQSDGGTAGAFSWIDTAIGTSIAGGSIGSAGSKKISSVLYP